MTAASWRFVRLSNAGGGGERVLWTAIACLQREEPDVVCVVYTGDAVISSKEAMITKVLVSPAAISLRLLIITLTQPSLSTGSICHPTELLNTPLRPA